MPNKGGHHGSSDTDELAEYNWDILIDDDGATSGQNEGNAVNTIRGRLTFEYYKSYMVPAKPLHFKELQIQLEGVTKIHFKAKAGSRMNIKEHLLLPDPDDPRTHSLTYHFMKDGQQPIDQKIIPAATTQDKKKRNQYSLPFDINLSMIPSLSLPASFSDDDGSVEYQLKAYAALTSSDVPCGIVARKIFVMKQGRLDLSLYPGLDRPFMMATMMKNRRKNSIFSFSGGGGGGKNNAEKNKKPGRGPRPRASFVVMEKQGFLPGETMTCQLNLDNPSGDCIGRICIELVQKITYFASRSSTSKTVTRVLDVQEFPGDELIDQSIRLELTVSIPEGLMPSFSRKKKCVDIFYFVQFSIEVDGILGLRGEAMIVIGTTRTLIRAISQNQKMAGFGSNGSNLVEGERDMSSGQNYSALPPSYAKLGVARRVSFGSLSLPPPPPYDQIGHEEGGENLNVFEEKVTRSHSTVM